MLTVLIGLARSGKSTFARKWQDEKDPNDLTRVVVNADNVRLALHGMRYVSSAEPVVHAIYSTMVKSLLLNQKLHLCMDDTHTTVSSIRAVLNMDADAKFIYIHCSVEEARKRAIDTNQSDLIPVIDRMNGSLSNLYVYGSSDDHDEYPSKYENWLEMGIHRSVAKIRAEVKKVKEYSDRSV